MPAVIRAFPAGIVPDRTASSNFGLFGFWAAANNYSKLLTSTATDTGNAVTLTTDQINGVQRLTSGANGGFTITLPATSALISALGKVPTDGTYAYPFSILNDNVGQTGTLTAGDASTTITGTATIATNTRRDFIVVVTAATTVTIYNIGSAAI